MADFSRLKSQLLTTGLQQKDNPLFQIINTLISALSSIEAQIPIIGGSSGGGGGSGAPAGSTYLTVNNEVVDLPNSRRVLAGDGIQLDDSVLNVRTIVNLLAALTILTETDETAEMPNSRRLTAGAGISFDVTTPGELEITSTAGVFIEWSVLTNGDPVTPELIFAGGDVIMTHVP